jgi:hypothetical protein
MGEEQQVSRFFAVAPTYTERCKSCGAVKRIYVRVSAGIWNPRNLGCLCDIPSQGRKSEPGSPDGTRNPEAGRSELASG